MADNIERTLGRIEGKLEMVLAGQTVQRETLESHDTRIQGLERWHSKVVGALALATFVIGVVVKALL